MKVKRVFSIVFLTFSIALGQLKNQMPQAVNVGDAMFAPNKNIFLGIFNPANFKMTHSYSLSYTSFGKNGLALGVYTNSMFYKISDPLSVQLDLSLVHSPYNTFGRQFQNQFNGIFINRAALNWRPSENTLINIEFRSLPSTFYYGSPYGYYPGWYRYDDAGFNDWYIGR